MKVSNNKAEHKLITIIGNVGSGKSTLTRLLAKEIPAKPVAADNLYKRNPFFPSALKDRTRWSFANDLWFLHERVKIARNFPTYLNKQHVVVDSGLLMSLAYTHSRTKAGYFVKDEWRLYKRIFDELCSDLHVSQTVVFLKAPFSLLLQRIKKRGRAFEIRFHKKVYLKQLDNSLSYVLRIVQNKGSKVIKVDVSKNDFVGNSRDVDVLVGKIMQKKD